MLALLGSFLGFLGALVPEALKLFQDGRDKKHELEIMRMQMAMQEKGISSRLEEITTQGYATEAVALQQSYRAELKYLGRYSASVRPTITYMLTAIYMIQKVATVYALFASPLPWQQGASLVTAALALWTAFDEMLLGTVLGFWFGSRQLKNARAG